jgi:hypothetical protein
MTETQVQIIDNLPVNEQVVFWRAEAMAWQARAKEAEAIVHQLAILKMVGAMLEMCWPFARKEKEEAPGGEN